MFQAEWITKKMCNLRNDYTKSLKPPKSGSARKQLSSRNSWLQDKLQFLSPFVASRPTVSNFEAVSIELFISLSIQLYSYWIYKYMYIYVHINCNLINSIAVILAVAVIILSCHITKPASDKKMLPTDSVVL